MHSFTRLIPLFLGLLALGFSGCTTSPDFGLKVTLSDGQEVKLLFVGPRPVMTKTDDFEVLGATVVPGEPGKLRYVFAVRDLRGRELRRVEVEDLTDEKAYLILDDKVAKKNEYQVWSGVSESLPLSDARFQWVTYESMSVRIFRLRITCADGSVHSLLQHTDMIQPFMKQNIRKTIEAAAVEAEKAKAEKKETPKAEGSADAAK